MYQQSGKLDLLSDSNDLDKYPQGSNFVTKRHLIGSHQVGLLFYSLLLGLSPYSLYFRGIFNFLFVPFWTYFRVVRIFLPPYLLNRSVT